MTTIRAQTIGKTSDLINNSICPVCHVAFRAGEQAVTCPTCRTPHHADCWVYNGNHCAQMGCTATATVSGATTATANQPAVMNQTANAYVPPISTPVGPPATPRPVNATLFGWLALLLAGLLIHLANRPTGVIVAAAAVAIVAVLVEYRRLGGPAGLAPHINVICGLALGGLGVALLGLVWPYALDILPALSRCGHWVQVVILALLVYIGAWGSSQTLAADSAGLVRRVAGLTIVYWVVSRLVTNSYALLWLLIGAALAATALMVIGLWDNKLVLAPSRLTGALLGALTMGGIVFGLLYLITEVDFFIDLTAGWSFLELEFTWRALLTAMVVFGASEGGAAFTVGLWRFLGWLAVLAFILGLTYVGGFVGLGLAEDHLSSDLWIVGAAVGGIVGFVLGVMAYRVVKGLFK
jgi:hypothetical protein